MATVVIVASLILLGVIAFVLYFLGEYPQNLRDNTETTITFESTWVKGQAPVEAVSKNPQSLAYKVYLDLDPVENARVIMDFAQPLGLGIAFIDSSGNKVKHVNLMTDSNGVVKIKIVSQSKQLDVLTVRIIINDGSEFSGKLWKQLFLDFPFQVVDDPIPLESDPDANTP